VPVEIAGRTYYRTSEACAAAKVSRATLFRWLKAGMLQKSHRDRRGWRLFTEDDLRAIMAECNRVEIEDVCGKVSNDNYRRE
jgi:predicted site-specific integrase-resolvase